LGSSSWLSHANAAIVGGLPRSFAAIVRWMRCLLMWSNASCSKCGKRHSVGAGDEAGQITNEEERTRADYNPGG
jgi:hypothetical protein